MIEIDLIEKAHSAPITCYPYKTSLVNRNQIAENLKKWRYLVIITSTQSPYVGPLLLVNNSTSAKRLCIDYRKFKKQLIDLSYPIVKMHYPMVEFLLRWT